MTAPNTDAQRLEDAARRAAAAAPALATLSSEAKRDALTAIAAALDSAKANILAANTADMSAATESGLAGPKLRRLELSESKLADMTAGIRQVAALPDPVNETTRSWTTDTGLDVAKVRTPLGVICMIYEARPAVTADAFALCFMSGNACLLKGGREAANSNKTIAEVIAAALAERFPDQPAIASGAITAVTTSDRGALAHLLTLDQHVDLVIPRGGETLIRFVHQHSTIPTVQHFNGVCHAYADKAADPDKALEIIATAKTSAPATCNALECALIHASIAADLLPRLAERAKADGFTIHACDRSRAAIGDHPAVTPATEDDWGTEYLDLDLALRVVDSLDDAIAHIDRYASNHTETIITEDAAAAEHFVAAARSSCVLVNASTRFNDGFSLGLGAEIGISTQRIHAYGPMGLEQLTIERYVVRGSGQTR